LILAVPTPTPALEGPSAQTATGPAPPKAHPPTVSTPSSPPAKRWGQMGPSSMSRGHSLSAMRLISRVETSQQRLRGSAGPNFRDRGSRIWTIGLVELRIWLDVYLELWSRIYESFCISIMEASLSFNYYSKHRQIHCLVKFTSNLLFLECCKPTLYSMHPATMLLAT